MTDQTPPAGDDRPSSPFDPAPDRATAEAFEDPRVGDRFHEMYSFWMYVVHIDGDRVVTMSSPAPCSFPRDGTVRIHETHDEFRKAFSYDTIPGYFCCLADRDNNVTGWYTPSPEPDEPATSPGPIVIGAGFGDDLHCTACGGSGLLGDQQFRAAPVPAGTPGAIEAAIATAARALVAEVDDYEYDVAAAAIRAAAPGLIAHGEQRGAENAARAIDAANTSDNYYLNMCAKLARDSAGCPDDSVIETPPPAPAGEPGEPDPERVDLPSTRTAVRRGKITWEPAGEPVPADEFAEINTTEAEFDAMFARGEPVEVVTSLTYATDTPIIIVDLPVPADAPAELPPISEEGAGR